MASNIFKNFSIALITASWLIIAPATMAAEHEAKQDKIGSVQQETAEAIEAIKQYSATRQDQALARAKALIDEIDIRIAELKAWIDQNWDPMQAVARQHAQQVLSRLEAQRADLAKAYSTLEASSSSAWENVKQSFLKSYRTMGKAFDEAKSEL